MFSIKDPEGKRFLVWALPDVATIGIKYIRQLSEKVESLGLNGGIIISNGKYTYSARANAPRKGIEIIPPNFPAFNVFKHSIVPKHQILSQEEKAKVLEIFRVKPYQIPLINTSDPIIKVIGGKAGDMVKIMRRSQTAGEYLSYRYVVEG